MQAIEIAQKTNPDVVLLDMVMPRQDGQQPSQLRRLEQDLEYWF